MNPLSQITPEGSAPRRHSYRWALLACGAYLACSVFVCHDAVAERHKKRKRPTAKPIVTKVQETKAKKGGKNQVFDFTGLTLGASIRTPQLLYFLDRAGEELKRASLKRRSFVPQMVLSITEEGL